MAAVAWLKRLESLSLSRAQKGAIVHKFFVGEWKKEEIQEFFDTCIQYGGEEELISALQGLLQGAGISAKKKVQFYLPEVHGAELVFVPRWLVLDKESFAPFVRTGYFVPMKGGQVLRDVATIRFEDLVDGEVYMLMDYAGLPHKVKILEKCNVLETKSCEDQLAGAMIREVQLYDLPDDRILRSDLPIHCQGSSDEQEFDAVLQDGEDKRFIGSARHVGHGTAVVEDTLQKVPVLADRARTIKCFPSYAPFQGRAVGCCIRLDTINEAQRQDVKHVCSRKGIALFQRSGAALKIQNIPFGGPQSLEPGFINMVVWGFRRLAR